MSDRHNVPRVENPATSIRWSRVDEPWHWVLATTTEDEEDMSTETDPEGFVAAPSRRSNLEEQWAARLFVSGRVG